MNINDEVIEQATKLYERKLATGLYNTYPPAALQMLFDDCVRQTVFMMEARDKV